MSRLPRTPEFFPKMKVRGSRRRAIAPWQRFAGAIGIAKTSLDEFGDAIRKLYS